MFDLGNVLIRWDPRFLYRKLLPDEHAVERFLAEVCTPEWNAAQDRGRPWAEGIAEAVAAHPHHEPLIRAFYERWDEMCPGPVEGTAEVVAELRAAAVPVYALSNWSVETFARVRPKYEVFDWFHGMVISGEERLAKPEPEIYERLLTRFRLDAGRTVFVDDSVANVEAAVACGLIGLRFTDAARLRADLAALGLPVSVAAA